jgi:hypothetical protein
MTEEQKDRLRELIKDLVMYNRDQVWEESRWDSSRGSRMFSEQNVKEAELLLEIFIEGL